MKNWKKVSLVSLTAFAAMGLVACGSNEKKEETKADPAKIEGNLTLWVDPANINSYKELVKGFEKENPDAKVNVVQSPTGSANAKTDVGKDPEKAADVFKVPNDQLGAMAEAGYINPLSPDATKWVQENDIEDA
ncbi:MAG: extracellular solute-binding protein, partial [Streptococcaceae bacterium]|nr:extracellular solute-binding protein [Streptococcaceae bacterium]